MSPAPGRRCTRGAVMAAVRCRPQPGLPACREELADLARRLLEALGLSDRCVEATLVGDGEMARLNAEFLGLAGPTNVLSFEASGEGEYLGEVVVCADTCAREARLYGQDPSGHLARLLCHGLLHLAGHAHGPAMDAAAEAALAAAPGPAAP